MNTTPPRVTRRTCLAWSLAAPSSPLLASLATGLPIAWLLGQREVHGAPASDSQFLILNLSSAGDPLNAGAPGTFGVEGVYHNQNASMAATETSFGTTQTTAAAPWANLPAAVRERTAFIHHRTYTNAHPNFFKVLGLFGVSKNAGGNKDSLPAVYGSELASALQTVQREPVILGNVGARITFEGREQPVVSPSALSAMLAGASDETLKNLQTLRETELDAIYKQLAVVGTPAQKDFLDRYATSRAQLTQVRERVGGLINADTAWTNDAAGQVRAAVAMVKLGLAPVIVTRIPFGGDNHADPNLQQEADETVSGVAAIASLLQQLDTAGLKDQVTFASFNVFGRTLAPVRDGNGRNHNLNHHTTLIIGSKIRGGVVGGVERLKEDFAATAFDSNTGAAGGAGAADVAPEASLEATSVTLGRALGLSQEVLDQRISGGVPINAVLATP